MISASDQNRLNFRHRKAHLDLEIVPVTDAAFGFRYSIVAAWTQLNGFLPVPLSVCFQSVSTNSFASDPHGPNDSNPRWMKWKRPCKKWYLFCFFFYASHAADPGVGAVELMWEAAKVSTHVASQTKQRPSRQGTNVNLLERLWSSPETPVGSSIEGTPADTRARPRMGAPKRMAHDMFSGSSSSKVPKDGAGSVFSQTPNSFAETALLSMLLSGISIKSVWAFCTTGRSHIVW